MNFLIVAVVFFIACYRPMAGLALGSVGLLIRVGIAGDIEDPILSLLVPLGGYFGSVVYLVRHNISTKFKLNVADYFLGVILIMMMFSFSQVKWETDAFLYIAKYAGLVLPLYYIPRIILTAENSDSQIRQHLFDYNVALITFGIYISYLALQVARTAESWKQISLEGTSSITIGYFTTLCALAGVGLALTFWERKQKFLMSVAIAAGTYSFLASLPTQKRGALISFVFGVAFIGIYLGVLKRRYGILALVVIALVVGGIIIPNLPLGHKIAMMLQGAEKSTIERTEIGDKALDRFYSKPFFGAGVRSSSWVGLYAHNIFLELASDLGILALFLSLGVYWEAIKGFFHTVINSDVQTVMLMMPVFFIGLIMPLFSSEMSMHRFLPVALAMSITCGHSTVRRRSPALAVSPAH
jgi:O-antigen ligase